MPSFTIPPDGEWHLFPEHPVQGITATSLSVEIDILPNGKGRARNLSARPVTVEYRLAPTSAAAQNDTRCGCGNY
jgi:hypothetical protein